MKQNQKGFTLIELLAVIVILAIIALIATPIVLSTIATAREGAAKESAYGAIEAVKTGFLEAQVKGNVSATSGTYDFSKSDAENQASTNGGFGITLNGTRPTAGTVTVDNNGDITIGTELKIGNYYCKYGKNGAPANEIGCSTTPSA